MTPKVRVGFDGVWKKFRRGERHDSLRDLIPSVAKRLVGKAPPRDSLEAEEFWALREVSFEVLPGQALGIIGHNGAGKSTLLKVLSRITEPTEGRVAITGRVNSLLEVGTGFHPELSGRENIFLNGAILGMSRAEMKARFDDIVDFSGVRKFIDTPVKRYSVGMYVRLAFAVAAHLEAEILVVDEVLSVGDAGSVQVHQPHVGGRGSGRTVLFVSHNFAAVRALTKRSIVFEGGRLTRRPGRGLAFYTASPGKAGHARLGPRQGCSLVEASSTSGAPPTISPARAAGGLRTTGMPGRFDATLRDQHNLPIGSWV